MFMSLQKQFMESQKEALSKWGSQKKDEIPNFKKEMKQSMKANSRDLIF